MTVFAGQLVGDVLADGSPWIMTVAGLGRAGGHGGPRGGIATQTPAEKMFLYFRCAGIRRSARSRADCTARERRRPHDAPNDGGQHRWDILNGTSCSFRLLRSSSWVTEHLARLRSVVLALDPLDVAVAQPFEHRPCCRRRRRAQVADVGPAGDEGHRHLVAQLALCAGRCRR